MLLFLSPEGYLVLFIFDELVESLIKIVKVHGKLALLYFHVLFKVNFNFGLNLLLEQLLEPIWDWSVHDGELGEVHTFGNSCVSD